MRSAAEAEPIHIWYHTFTIVASYALQIYPGPGRKPKPFKTRNETSTHTIGYEFARNVWDVNGVSLAFD